MTNYNLTFNEAIAAGEKGEFLENNYLDCYKYKFNPDKNEWQFLTSKSGEEEWLGRGFYYEETKARWRIVPKQQPIEDSEKESHLMLLEERVSWLEEKLENIMKQVDSLVDKSVIEKADIKTLYGICDNHEEVIISFEEKLERFEKKLKERYEEWDEGAYSAIVKSINNVHWENLSIEKRLEVLESTFLMKIDFDERLTKAEEKIKTLISCGFKDYCNAYVDNMEIDEELKDRLEAYLKINDKDSYGGSE